MARIREILKNLALSAVSTLLLLFLIEMGLRLSEAVPASTLEYASPEEWAANPGPLRPGQRFTDHFKRGLPYTLSVNNLGFRGPDIPYARPAGALRVLCLGDSYTFGAYVNDTETWPAQLEATLAPRMDGRPLQVINAGISGFTIRDELDFMKEHGLGLQPDAVVLAFVMNDLADLTRQVSSREMIRRSSLENSRSLLGPVRSVLRQTAIYNGLFLLKAYWRKSTGTDPTLQEVDIRHLLTESWDPRTLELFRLYEENLTSLRALLDEEGARQGRTIPLLLVLYPYWEQVARGASDRAQKEMLALAARAGVPAIDLLPGYRRQDPTGAGFFHMPLDHHPSAAGYRQAALEITEVLLPLLSPAPASGTNPPRSGSAETPAATP